MPNIGKMAAASLASRDLLGLDLNLGHTVKNALNVFNQTSFAKQSPELNNSESEYLTADMGDDANLPGIGHFGISPLGTANAPHLPPFMTNNPMPSGFPWGNRNVGTNYYDNSQVPNTGVTRHYDWTLSKGQCAPDGVTIDCALVNNQFPGPTVEANWGDWIEVKVTNNFTDEGAAIHWHGFLQKGTQYMDGVPGYGQCPIAPGSEFTYRFQASLYGSTWYHSHYSAQYGSGLVGPMVVYGPNNTHYDTDLGPITIMDWYHEYYTEAIDGLFKPFPNAIVPRADSNTINGKGTYPCDQAGDLECKDDAPMASFNFTSGQTHRLRLINPSSVAVQKITIDNHKFTVIENDFVPIESYETDVITLGVGQRSDVLVTANGTSTDAVYMRAYRPADCALSNGNEEVKAMIYYEDANRDALPISPPGPNAYNNYCGNDDLSLTKPLMKMPAMDPDVTEILPIELKSNGTHLVWYQANRTFRLNYNDPILERVNQGDLDFPYIENVHNYGTNKTLRFIIENPGNQYHPMHFHGHNFQVLAEGPCYSNQTVFPGNMTSNTTANINGFGQPQVGSGSGGETWQQYGKMGSCWDGTITNPDNPQRRDVQNLNKESFIVLQWKQDNPGVWPLHCHIAWHLSAGFVWTVVENPDAIQNEMSIPDIMPQTCNDWDAWSKSNIVDQIDDGL